MKKVQILVVEDERIVGADIKMSVERIGYEVSGVAHSAEDAIKKAQSMRPDLVLMDVVLEGDMDGIEAASIIRSRFGIPVVYLTAYSDDKTVERAKVTEPFGYLIKPFQERELHSIIEIALYKHEMERKLMENQEWLSTTLKSIGDAVITTDTQGFITFINPVAQALTGWKREEASERHLEDVFTIMDTEKGELIENPVSKILKAGDVVELAHDATLIARDGTKYPIHHTCAPIKSDQGNIAGVVLAFRDITERRKSEEQIKQLQEYLQLQIDRMPVALIVWDTDFRVKTWNPSAEKIFGFTEKEARGKHPYDFIVPKNAQPHVDKIWKRLLRGDSTAHSVNENMTKDGRTIMCDWLNTPLKSADGSVNEILSMTQDITDRLKAEKNIKDSEERLKILFEYAPDGYYLNDLKGNFINGNKAAEELTGYKREELIGKNMLKLKLLSPADIPRAASLLAKNVLGKPTGPDEFLLNRKDGTQVAVEIRTYPVKIKGRTLVLGNVRDITERKKVLDELKTACAEIKKTQQELIQSEKLAALGRFSSGVAHEIKNPLGVILGGTEFLENSLTQADSSVKTTIEKIKEATHRANIIIQDMLKFASPSDLKTEKIKLVDLVNEALSLLKYGTPLKNIKIETQFAKKNLSIEADKNQIQQVFFNLMTNAVDAMPEGGKILIKAYEMLEEEPHSDGRFCAIEVKDTGEGIQEAHLKRLFEPFFTTKKDKKGIGLGLSMSKMIIDNHKGNLEIESKPGEGTTAKIVLPRL